MSHGFFSRRCFPKDLLWQSPLSTQWCALHTPLCRTPSFTTPSFTHNFVTHHLSHTALAHTSFHTQLCHTLSFTHNFHTQLCQTHLLSLSHNIFHVRLCHTQFFFTCRSSTTSFVFPSFPVPPTTFVAHYWKKLTCGVIRSFTFFFGAIFSYISGLNFCYNVFFNVTSNLNFCFASFSRHFWFDFLYDPFLGIFFRCFFVVLLVRTFCVILSCDISGLNFYCDIFSRRLISISFVCETYGLNFCCDVFLRHF